MQQYILLTEDNLHFRMYITKLEYILLDVYILKNLCSFFVCLCQVFNPFFISMSEILNIFTITNAWTEDRQNFYKIMLQP